MANVLRIGGWALAIALAIALAVWGFAQVRAGADDSEAYRTQALDRGDLSRTVSATGRLEPVATVDVGSTVSGPLVSVEVDFNDRVRAGQVLARIDPQSFRARVQQLEAAVAQAAADAAFARSELDRAEALLEREFVSEQAVDQRQAALDRAEAQVASAQAQLDSARVDLGRTIIRAPIDGVVVDRRVDPGQSVAANFQAPTLFLIAQDPNELQALIAVDEADIGEVREGQDVRFTVDAYPGEEFEAEVAQVRQQGVETQGVVSYQVVVRVRNPGGRLLPGMTANAEILIDQRQGVLRLPNAALRFRPGDPRVAAKAEGLAAAGPNAEGGGPRRAGGGPAEQWIAALELSPDQAEQVRQAARDAVQGLERPGPQAEPAERRAFARRAREAALRRIEPLLNEAQRARLAEITAEAGARRGRQALVWVLREGEPVPVQIRIGVADDAFTEILSGEIEEGDALIVGGGPQPPNGGARGPGGPGGPGVRIRGA